MKSEHERMLQGELYLASDPELQSLASQARRLLWAFNRTHPDEATRRDRLLRQLLGGVGQNGTILPPFHCDYGCHITIGENFYANVGLTILDVARVEIGDGVMLGPYVQIYTATHPLDADVRESFLEYGLPIRIGHRVWLGGLTVVNPGVSIGDNSIIGSGAVVTTDIPANVIAVGNPCRVLRELDDKDRRYWEQRKEDYVRERSRLPGLPQ